MPRSSHDRSSLYAGRKPIDLPLYTITETGHYLQVPPTTVRWWAAGRKDARKTYKPVIRMADPARGLLSFHNLVELHVLSAIRRKHKVQLPAVRRAVAFLEKRFGHRHPLADAQMSTDGKDLFVERYGTLMAVSSAGQTLIRDAIAASLKRIERDPTGIPIKLFPYTSTQRDDSSEPVVINPRVQFGRPCLQGTGIPTRMVAERYKAGDSMHQLAEDYGREPREIEEAIRFELELNLRAA